jgi:hypothetical protein
MTKKEALIEKQTKINWEVHSSKWFLISKLHSNVVQSSTTSGKCFKLEDIARTSNFNQYCTSATTSHCFSVCNESHLFVA